MTRKKSEPIPIILLGFLYLLSVLFFVLSNDVKNVHIASILNSIPQNIAKGLNIGLLLLNTSLLRNIFKKRDVSANIMAFVYLLLYNKIWFLNAVSTYLISDGVILFCLFVMIKQREGMNINLYVVTFYLSMLFSVEFLLGVNWVYAVIIPGLLLSIFIIPDWRLLVVFMVGILFPIYLFISIHWLITTRMPAYLQELIHNNIQPWKQLNHIQWTREFIDTFLHWKTSNLLIVFSLSLMSGLKEATSIYYYALKQRLMALFFFFLMFFSLINYLFKYGLHQQYDFSIIALPFAYYIGQFLMKTSSIVQYFVLFLLFVSVSFL